MHFKARLTMNAINSFASYEMVFFDGERFRDIDL